MSYYNRIETKLRENFDPTYLLVRDDSAQHAGHSGSHPDGETHFHIEIRAPYFNNLTRVKAQKAVYKALDSELQEHVHALSMKVEGETV